jgi:aminocarboxymuconate-semialdehyde decarboxylase
MIIDIHGHVAHPDLIARYPMPPSLGDIEGMLEVKAAAGIDLTIVGSPTGAATMVPVPGLDTYDQPADRLAVFHEWLAGVVAAHRAHLRAYARCNAFADEATLTRTATTLRDGGFVGIIANTSVRGEYLDAARADDFFAMVDELDVPVLLHPGTDPAACQGVSDYGLVEMVGRYCDITMGLAAIVLSGRLERYPRLRLIGASGGGALGVLPRRLDLAWRPAHWDDASGKRPVAGPPLSRPPRTTVAPSTLARRLFVDTTTDGTHPLAINLDAFGASQIMFGTDAPPVPVIHHQKLAQIRDLPIPEADRSAILGGNAVRVFKLDDLVPVASGERQGSA